MRPELVLGFGLFFTVFLLLLAAKPAAEHASGAADRAQRARRYVDRKIEENLEGLVQRYVEAGGSAGGEVPESFDQVIQSFIASEILDDLAPGEEDVEELRIPVRELVVLEREYVHAKVMDRIRAHLDEPRSST
ncbi:MAG: hypothetical protein ACREH6_03975 [Geminicoccaceae bacterium]